MFANIPEVKLGIIAVSRGCFPMALSERRRAAIKAAYGEGLYECPVTVENEKDALKAVEDVRAAGCMLSGDLYEVIDRLSYAVSQYL